MRVIIKNADFSVYGIADMSGLMSTLMTKFSGITSSNKSVVENFLRALGADGSNTIWSKIKHLYMPCLGITSDGDNALYDIITGNPYPKENAAVTSKIYNKRGVGVTNYATEKGQSIGTVPLSNITAANQSFFASFALYSGQSLSSSSGFQVQLGPDNSTNAVGVKWESAVMNFSTTAAGTSVGVNKEAGWGTPNWAIMSCKENGSRKFICADGDTTSSNFESYLTVAPTVACLERGYVITSMFGICSGLTASEADAVSTAISTFITAFGIENS